MKPSKGESAFSQQLYSEVLTLLRVVIEHTHSGTKRLCMVADTLWLRGE